MNPFYKSLTQEIEAVLCGKWISDLANISALLFEKMPDLNWAGFYLLEKDQLWLGPFQGRLACTQIKLGRGVCGKAAASRETIVVPNVHEFPDHIACDTRSQSEIVIPLLRGDELLGVLDVDSPSLNRFYKEDAEGLKEVVRLLMVRHGGSR